MPMQAQLHRVKAYQLQFSRAHVKIQFVSIVGQSLARLISRNYNILIYVLLEANSSISIMIYFFEEKSGFDLG